jgi:GntR family transcriptional repressor for pyruvate dehydrogenase complex
MQTGGIALCTMALAVLYAKNGLPQRLKAVLIRPPGAFFKPPPAFLKPLDKKREGNYAECITGQTSYLLGVHMDFKEIPNKKTYKQIIEQIIALILKGELKNGDQLPGERALSELLGASRSSIREAFRTLEVLGILEVRQGGGTYVRSFHIAPFINTIAPLFLKDVDIMGDMMDFRMMLEGEAVKAAALLHDAHTIKEMEESVARMEDDDPGVAEQADIDFHMSIFSATGNKVFILAGECLSYILYTSIHTSRTRLIADRAIAERWIGEHKSILAALKVQDPEQAFHALRSHLEGVRSYILQ